jgi:rhodanese-related sulfurtransferase
MNNKNNNTLVNNIFGNEAWEILKNNPSAHLIDVRFDPEIKFVGYPTLKSINRKLIFIPWLTYPGFNLNENFVKKIFEEIPNKGDFLIFICKSGGRSEQAASLMSELGYQNCYNIVDGFEGSMNSLKQRGGVSGWKFLGLPWEQT